MKVKELIKYLESFDKNQDVYFLLNPSRNLGLENEKLDLSLKVELQGSGSEIPTLFTTLENKYNGALETIYEELENSNTKEINIKITKDGVYFECTQENNTDNFRELNFTEKYKTLQDVPTEIIIKSILLNL